MMNTKSFETTKSATHKTFFYVINIVSNKIKYGHLILITLFINNYVVITTGANLASKQTTCVTTQNNCINNLKPHHRETDVSL